MCARRLHIIYSTQDPGAAVEGQCAASSGSIWKQGGAEEQGVHRPTRRCGSRFLYGHRPMTDAEEHAPTFLFLFWMSYGFTTDGRSIYIARQGTGVVLSGAVTPERASGSVYARPT